MEKMSKEKEVFDKSIKDYIDKLTTPIFNKVLQENLSNSMTTNPLYKSNGFKYLIRFNNYRRQIQVKEKTNSTIKKIKSAMCKFVKLNINPHTKILSIKNYEKDITIQYGRNTLTAIYSCPLINGNKQTYLIERDTIDDINARIDEIKQNIKLRLDNALKSFSRKFDLSMPFKRPLWSRHENWIKGDEFIDNIPREAIIHDTIGKKVYGEGWEFAGGKDKEPTAHIKNYIKTRAIEDIAPSIADAITEVYTKFGSFIAGMTPVLQQINNQNIEIIKLRRDINKIQRRKSKKNLNKDIRKWL